MRAIAEEAFELVKKFKGSHSGEHGDGIVRSEFHEMMFGERLVRDFGEVKALFDPEKFFNPGKIVGAPKFDDRDYLRYSPRYEISDFTPTLDWSEYPAARMVSRARPRCATTTAPAAKPKAAPCALLSRDAQRAGRHRGPRQHAASGAVGQLATAR
jgi:hypothetical protein